MTTKTKEYQPASVNMLSKFVGDSQSAWIRLTIGVTLIALVLNAIARVVRGLPVNLQEMEIVWVILSLLSTWVFAKPALENAVKNLQSLLEPADVDDILSQFSTPKHYRIGWIIYAIGAFVGFLDQYRDVLSEGDFMLHHALYIPLEMIVFALIAWFLHTTFSSMSLITNLVQKTNPSNIYDPTPFKPIAQWSLVISLSIITVLTLEVLMAYQFRADPIRWGIRISFLIFSMVAFFATMWSTHKVMAKNKYIEIKRINDLLAEIHVELIEALSQRQSNNAESLASLNEILNKEKASLKEIQEWPYTSQNLGGLISSMTIPIVISFIKTFIT